MSNMIHSLMTKTLRTTPRVHVTYSRVERDNNDSLPKNTLVILHDDVEGVIYFGIARCNLVANDVCRKDVGRTMARQRAELAMTTHKTLKSRIHIDEHGLSGKVAANYQHFLKGFFYSYDLPMFTRAHRDPWQRERHVLAAPAAPLEQPAVHTEPEALAPPKLSEPATVL